MAAGGARQDAVRWHLLLAKAEPDLCHHVVLAAVLRKLAAAGLARPCRPALRGRSRRPDPDRSRITTAAGRVGVRHAASLCGQISPGERGTKGKGSRMSPTGGVTRFHVRPAGPHWALQSWKSRSQSPSIMARVPQGRWPTRRPARLHVQSTTTYVLGTTLYSAGTRQTPPSRSARCLSPLPSAGR